MVTKRAIVRIVIKRAIVRIMTKMVIVLKGYYRDGSSKDCYKESYSMDCHKDSYSKECYKDGYSMDSKVQYVKYYIAKKRFSKVFLPCLLTRILPSLLILVSASRKLSINMRGDVIWGVFSSPSSVLPNNYTEDSMIIWPILIIDKAF